MYLEIILIIVPTKQKVYPKGERLEINQIVDLTQKSNGKEFQVDSSKVGVKSV